MVRPLDIKPPERVWDDIDPTTVAPVNEKGIPDLYNYIPFRLVTIEEARARGWKQYYIAEPCKYGHVAPRYVSNRGLCIDCDRIGRGKQPIGGQAAGLTEPKKAAKAREEAYKKLKSIYGSRLHGIKELEVNEKRFLEAYAKYRDLDEACSATNQTVAQVEARRSFNDSFRKSMEFLEERLKITLHKKRGYEWTDQKREKLIEIYVDTGDLATGRDSIEVTPSEYFRELERNSDFSARIQDATPKAEQALEERAIQLALAGNGQLLQKILSAKKPEYRERVQMDMNVTEKMSDSQLNARLTRLLNKIYPPIIIEARESTASRDIGRDSEEEKPEEDRNLLQYSGNSSPVP